MKKVFDFIVIGQGLTALATLSFLAKSAYQVLWLRPEKNSQNSVTSASFGQQRVTALSAASVRLLQRLLPAANWGWPLTRIAVSRAGEFGSVLLTASQAQVAALGYIIENNALSEIFSQQQPENLTIGDLVQWRIQMTDAYVQVIATRHQVAPVEKNQENQSAESQESSESNEMFYGRAVLLADGQSADLATFLSESADTKAPQANTFFPNFSKSLGALPIFSAGSFHQGFRQVFEKLSQAALPSSASATARQTAIVLQGESRGAPAKTAAERFTRHGVLAALPLAETAEITKVSLVWSWRGDLPSRAPAFWWQAIAEEFAGLYGSWQHFTPPVFYPLTPFCRSQVAFGRVLLLGNAAQTLHPLAGQGFNLIVRDLATLRTLLTGEALADVPALFEQYQRLRQADRWTTFAFTQMLSRLPMSGFLLFAVDNTEIFRKFIENQGLGWQFPLPLLSSLAADMA